MTSHATPRRRPAPFVAASIGGHALAAAGCIAAPDLAPWFVGAVVADHAALTAAGLAPRSRLLGPNVVRLPAAAAARGEVALTFDDGPEPAVTPRLLDALDALGVRASFFCIAERVQRHAALAREIVRRGHQIENHTARHRHTFSLLGPRGYAAEIGRAQALVADTVGRAPTCFRAPAGFRNVFLAAVLARHRLALVSWTRRGFDTREASAERVRARLERGLAAGDILLLHDGNAARAPGGEPVLLGVLPPLVARLRQAGLRSVPVGEALARAGAAA